MATDLRDVLPMWTADCVTAHRRAALSVVTRLERECAEAAKDTGDLDAAVEIGKAARNLKKARKLLEVSK